MRKENFSLIHFVHKKNPTRTSYKAEDFATKLVNKEGSEFLSAKKIGTSALGAKKYEIDLFSDTVTSKIGEIKSYGDAKKALQKYIKRAEVDEYFKAESILRQLDQE